MNRVTVLERIFKAKTWDEIQEERKAEREAQKENQIESVGENDMIWRMPYRQYKQHYADCETIIDSYREGRYRGQSSIEVIIREGRLKNSGVRGEHYSGYRLRNENGEQMVYRAVKEENAIKRAEKEYGGNWECTKVFNYGVWR